MVRARRTIFDRRRHYSIVAAKVVASALHVARSIRTRQLKKEFYKRLVMSNFYRAFMSSHIKIRFFLPKTSTGSDFVERFNSLHNLQHVLFAVTHAQRPLVVYDMVSRNENLRCTMDMYEAKIAMPEGEKDYKTWAAKLALRFCTASNQRGMIGPKFKLLDGMKVTSFLGGSLAKCDAGFVENEVNTTNLASQPLFCFNQRCGRACGQSPYHIFLQGEEVYQVGFPDATNERPYVLLPEDLQSLRFWRKASFDEFGNHPLRHALGTKSNFNDTDINKQLLFDQLKINLSQDLKIYQTELGKTNITVYHILSVSHPDVTPTAQNLEALWRDNRAQFGVYTGATHDPTNWRTSLLQPGTESDPLARTITTNSALFLLGYRNEDLQNKYIFTEYNPARLAEAIDIEIIRLAYTRRNELNRKREPYPINIRSEYISLTRGDKSHTDKAVNFLLSGTPILSLGTNAQPFMEGDFHGCLEVLYEINIPDDYRERVLERRLELPEPQQLSQLAPPMRRSLRHPRRRR